MGDDEYKDDEELEPEEDFKKKRLPDGYHEINESGEILEDIEEDGDLDDDELEEEDDDEEEEEDEI